MATNACSLCAGVIDQSSRELCDQCRAMEERLDYLLLNHREATLKFVADKFNQANDPSAQRYDRRQKPYLPPPGIHTPDRRQKIRRVAKLDIDIKRRQSDQ
jgi:hypothetical protein